MEGVTKFEFRTTFWIEIVISYAHLRQSRKQRGSHENEGRIFFQLTNHFLAGFLRPMCGWRFWLVFQFGWHDTFVPTPRRSEWVLKNISHLFPFRALSLRILISFPLIRDTGALSKFKLGGICGQKLMGLGETLPKGWVIPQGNILFVIVTELFYCLAG